MQVHGWSNLGYYLMKWIIERNELGMNALSNGMPESGLVITRYDFSIMVLIKVVFYTALYYFIECLEKRDNLCGAVLGLVAEMELKITWINALTIWE